MAQDVAKTENRVLTNGYTLDSRLLSLTTTRTEVVGGACVDVWQPVPVPDEIRHATIRAVSDLERELMPAKREWIAGRVLTLLSHFYTPEMPETVQKAVSRDWLAVLGDYPRWAIERACLDYLARDTSKRPTPGNIRDLAEAEVSDRAEVLAKLKGCLEYNRAPERIRGGTVTMAEALASCEAAKAALRKSITEDEEQLREKARLAKQRDGPQL